MTRLQWPTPADYGQAITVLVIAFALGAILRGAIRELWSLRALLLPKALLWRPSATKTATSASKPLQANEPS